ncbi:hypothetical protein K227x_42250 [Rubripirellula lacrimiformis]|uniref:Methane oxygenase PmoA n=1 Tax=Rubripirellula lacrimiformis TaxID=1930273 RepID=A0A517NFB5_9BACT|nr:PmoA family protein [Rubripirellula lacrimiformis]QDT05820.1 hypothetical protein K227x_42250 [Rubripirellula lacrimiformis]
MNASVRTLCHTGSHGLNTLIGFLRPVVAGIATLFVGAIVVNADGPAASPAAAPVATSQTLRVEETTEPAGWKIFDGDELVAGYLVESNGKPVIYPVVGPSGQAMTRRFPIESTGKNEREDHQHHRSMWMTHGEVNGFDFWADEKNQGDIVQRSGHASVLDDGTAVIVTHNDWISPDGDRVLSDVRRFAFFSDQGRRFIDCDVLLKATDGDVNFGDTKEGSFGMRLAGTMKVDAKLGGLVTSAEGKINSDAWGKTSAWVDYSGPVALPSGQTETAGVTIHDHPGSFGFPCRWHVRTYGLFAANPFGKYHFVGGEKTPGVILKKGSEMQLHYRVVLHDGPLDAQQAAADQKQFENTPRPNLE